MAEPEGPRAPAFLTVEAYIDHDYPDSVAKAEIVRGALRLMPPPELVHGAAPAELTSLPEVSPRSHVTPAQAATSTGSSGAARSTSRHRKRRRALPSTWRPRTIVETTARARPVFAGGPPLRRVRAGSLESTSLQ